LRGGEIQPRAVSYASFSFGNSGGGPFGSPNRGKSAREIFVLFLRGQGRGRMTKRGKKWGKKPTGGGGARRPYFGRGGKPGTRGRGFRAYWFGSPRGDVGRRGRPGARGN